MLGNFLQRSSSAAQVACVIKYIGAQERSGPHRCGHGAIERSQGRSPFRLILWFAGPKVNADRTELGGATRLRRIAEDIGAPGDLEADKTGRYYRDLELCFQQSASNSASP